MRYALSRAVAPGKSFELVKAYYAGWLHAPYKPATVPFVDDAATWSTYELAEQASKEVPAGETCVWVVFDKLKAVPIQTRTQKVSDSISVEYPVIPQPFIPTPHFNKD